MTRDPASTQDWDRAALALKLLVLDPEGLGGAVIRMRAGPGRDIVLAILRDSFPRMAKLHPGIDDTQLFGGIDIAATLSGGRLARSTGLLERTSCLCLTMAERCPDDLAAKLAQHLDHAQDTCFFALDEGAEESEALPASLGERLAFQIAPTGRSPLSWRVSMPRNAIMARAVQHTDNDIEALVVAAEQFGVLSLRAPLQALAAARAHAALNGRDALSEADLSTAAALVYAHRATRMPPEPVDEKTAQEAQQPAPNTSDEGGQNEQDHTLPQGDMLIEAVKALLPPEVLAGMGQIGRARTSQGSGYGQKRKGNRRGRPLPSCAGRLDGRARLDIVGTLRAAAPWQGIRRKVAPRHRGLHVRGSDLRLKRYETKSDRLIIFTVDASGSAAISRLNEAKGAIELLLGDAYAARDHVALVSFRGEDATCLLAPTRSLVQTKRKLAALPGGGGTPLAAGMQEALMVAEQARERGMTPVIVIATDGKANIALDGSPDRAQAREDATRMAHHLRVSGFETLVIDMSPRPQPVLRDLAQHLDARYLPLPRADAERLSGAVRTVLDTA